MKHLDKELTCPIAEASKFVGDFWNILIFRELLTGAKRFNELQIEIEEITNSTLSSKLKALVENGFVSRHQFNQIPPKVEYSLTEKGKALKPVVEAIREFGRRL